MTRRHFTLLTLCLVSFLATLHAARLTLFIDGDNRTAYDASRGKVGRSEWTTAVTTRKGTILTDDFQGVNIDVPADKETSVGHFSIFFSQAGGYSTQAGNTAPQKHPTGVFVSTTGTGSTAGKNDETIQGLELRFETLGPVTKTLELRFNPPIFAWAADVFSVDGKGFGQGNTPESNDHTTLHVLGHSFDFTQISAPRRWRFFGVASLPPSSSIPAIRCAFRPRTCSSVSSMPISCISSIPAMPA